MKNEMGHNCNHMCDENKNKTNNHDLSHQKEHSHKEDCCCSAKPISLTPLSKQTIIDNNQRTEIRIMEMDCPVEENLIRKKLEEMSNVKELNFNLLQRILTVTHDKNTLDLNLNYIIKGGAYLEIGRKLKILALDKTGTITHGKPVQTDVIIYNSFDRQETLKLANSLANNSTHPVSQAIINSSSTINLYKTEQFKEIIGQGITGLIQGQIYYLGNLLLTRNTIQCDQKIKTQVEQFEKQGKTVILLNNGKQILGLFAIADTVKDTSNQSIT